jgi:hypothetical protein
MRKLILSLMVLASLVSCGKDNKVGAVGSSSTAITVDDTYAKALGVAIDNSLTSFYQKPLYGKFGYVTTTSSTSNTGNNCEEKSGWFGIKYYVCKSTASTAVVPTSYVMVSSVILETKRGELRSIINSSTAGAIYQYGTRYTVRTTSGVLYTIDTSYPIEANPISTQQPDGQITYYAGFYNY